MIIGVIGLGLMGEGFTRRLIETGHAVAGCDIVADKLAAAVARGVRVRALTAHTNRGGTKSLRKLEMSLLEAGVTVSRTADDLVRYHGKMMIVDSKLLHVYGFNFTGLDIAKSRSFGVISKNVKLVNEAARLFTADFDRLAYSPFAL